jgi:hypothetical protein
MKVVRVEKHEFELEDGSVLPIQPPLKRKMRPKEFQKHYDRACFLVKSIKDARRNQSNTAPVGRRRKTSDDKNGR